MTDALARLRPSAAVAAVVALACLAGVTLTSLGLQDARIPLAVCYVSGYWYLAWRWPHAALMLIFASAPLQSDLSGGMVLAKFSLTEINLALTVPVFVLHSLVNKKTIHPGPITISVLLYLAICVASSWSSWRGTTSLSIAQMFLYLVVSIALFSSFAPSERHLLVVLRAGALAGALLALAALVTGFHFLGLHKNGFGGSLAAATILNVELWMAASTRRQRSFYSGSLALSVIALVLCVSRGGWIGALVGVVTILVMRRKVKSAIRVLVLLVPVLAVSWSALPQEKRDYATGFERGRRNIDARYESIDFARNEFDKNQLWGTGVGLRKEYDATNLMWLVLAETGVLGLGAFALIHAAFLRMVRRTRELVPRTDPVFSLLTVAAALVLCKLMHGMVDHYWSRGSVSMAWGAVGMATAVYYGARRRPQSEVPP